MARLEFDPRSLAKGELLMGLGRGRALHITPDGHVKELSSRNLPDYAIFLYPLVAKVTPEEFLATGEFADILELEQKLGDYVGSAEEFFQAVGPLLVRDGIAAARVAKALIEISPLKSVNLSNDARVLIEGDLRRKIIEYYPGSARSQREKKKPRKKIILDTGKHCGKDEISF